MQWKPSARESGVAAEAIGTLTAALLAYGALWVCLASLGALSVRVLPFLLPGAVVAGLLPLLAKRSHRLAVLLYCLLAVGVWYAARSTAILEGSKLFWNRLAAASEAKQRYLYDKFAVIGSVEQLPVAMLPLGLLTGLWYGWSLCSRVRALGLVPGTLLLFGLAWLGIAPRTGWLALLLLSLIGCLVLPTHPLPLRLRIGVLLATALICLTVWQLLPGTSTSVQAFSEGFRDRLAVRTLAYGSQADLLAQAESEALEETRPFSTQDAASEAEADVPHTRLEEALPLILLTLLLLFVPAVWRDRLNRRRAANRAWMQADNPRLRAEQGFLSAMRWLFAAGLEETNQPYPAYLTAISNWDPKLGQEFEKTVPLWLEAAYSTHEITAEAAAQIAAFQDAARQLAWKRMSLRQRFRVSCLLGL